MKMISCQKQDCGEEFRTCYSRESIRRIPKPSDTNDSLAVHHGERLITIWIIFIAMFKCNK